MAQRDGVIDGVLAARRDDHGCRPGEEARGAKGVVAHGRYDVVGEHEARAARIGAVGVADEGGALAARSDGARQGDGEGRLAGAAEDGAADAEDTDAVGQAQGTGNGARAGEGPRRTERAGRKRGITALETAGDARTEKVGVGGAPVQAGIMAQSCNPPARPRPGGVPRWTRANPPRPG